VHAVEFEVEQLADPQAAGSLEQQRRGRTSRPPSTKPTTTLKPRPRNPPRP
jgi:hypothetical protein